MKEDYLKKLFYALSDKTRLKIVRILIEDSEVCVCSFQDIFKTSQPKVSFHLRILRDVGIVKAEKKGKWTYYSIDYIPSCIRGMIEKIPLEEKEFVCEARYEKG